MEHSSGESCCHPKKNRRIDWFFWSGFFIIISAYVLHALAENQLIGMPLVQHFTASTYSLFNQMWWGILLGMLFIGLLNRVPREMVMGLLGTGTGFKGIMRATLAGLAFDLCSHGVLLVGMKLYERGASLGQVMAFLIASPWNSFSLTVILWALVGFKWMILFLVLSAVVAIISGLIFERLVLRGILPGNPYRKDMAADYELRKEMKKLFSSIELSIHAPARMLWEGFVGSKVILRWLFLGVIIAAAIRTFAPLEHFQMWFGPTMMGLGLTLIAATVIEVCSEGATPIAADLLNRAHAPGNGFAFLMTGVSTDYTELMALKETTSSWKVALFLPLVTVPQIVILATLLNY